jgi:rubrerythrin
MSSFFLQKAIETAIQAEELGVKFYSKLATKFAGNSELKSIFEHLAKDEVLHHREFKALLEKASFENIDVSDEDELYFMGCDISKYFSNMEDIKTDISPVEVFKQALEFEKESVLFYTGIRDLIGINEILETIIAKEKIHVKRLMKYILDESSFRGIEDKW